MKIVPLTAALLALVLAPAAHAQPATKATPVSPTAAAFLAQFATGGTYSVSWAQFEAFRKQRYTDTDRNQDGHVDEQEYVDEYLQRFDVRLADARTGHLRQTDIRFKALDRDGNGAISRAEYDAAGERTWAGYEASQNATQETAAASSRDPLKMPTSHTANGMLELYDRNQDGAVDRDEFDAVRAAGFAATDADGNGTLSLAEYTAEFSGRLEQQRQRVRADAARQARVRFASLDKDTDGRMTFAEYQLSGKRMFDRADSNGDGIVDARDPEPVAGAHSANGNR
ncbi:EF-hand domain-containing protein [Stenotrophomonas rhizophila]|uniref:EF-hand domain-containing protein n=1 Tax=Stenotrophomonas rhizophila TaxID=216778 RepID=UPI00224AF7AF|nr:EF-hand domain-containing protein [Stenotrophomonas rhizophila]MCX2919417.1 EF-hand domain-containing protein [Stenotrophomonas rhizophila]